MGMLALGTKGMEQWGSLWTQIAQAAGGFPRGETRARSSRPHRGHDLRTGHTARPVGDRRAAGQRTPLAAARALGGDLPARRRAAAHAGRQQREGPIEPNSPAVTQDGECHRRGSVRDPSPWRPCRAGGPAGGFGAHARAASGRAASCRRAFLDDSSTPAPQGLAGLIVAATTRAQARQALPLDGTLQAALQGWRARLLDTWPGSSRDRLHTPVPKAMLARVLPSPPGTC
ncbi:MAG: hypothetical protein U1E17_01055 [Geminicoccaceae bacterium]